MKQIEDGVHRIDGQEVIDWLRSSPVVTYRYKANRSGLWMMFFVGALVFGIAAYLAARSDLALMIHKLAFAILTAFGLWCWYKPIRWGLFSLRNYVALSDGQLLIGRGKSADLIDLGRLTPETVDLEAMGERLYSSVVPIRIGSYRRDVVLVALYVHLEEFEKFFGELIPVIVPDEVVAQLSPQAPDAAPDDVKS